MAYKKLSILIPVYNELKTVKKLLKKVENVKLQQGIEKEIIITDDFSTDGTREILQRIEKHKVFSHEENKGKGAVIRTALRHSTGDIVIIQDADLEYDPNQIPSLIQPILDGKTM